MKSTSRKLQEVGLPGIDLYASSSGEMGLGEGAVISLLNMERNPGAKHVAELIEAFQRAVQRMESIKASSGGEHYVAINALAEINGRLSKFRWSPAIFGITHPEPHFKVRYVMFPGKSNNASLELEQYATQWIVDHIEAVQRVRRCHRPECRKWFFAKTDHQKYCGNICRQRDAAQGESFKEKRRLYMKKYRRQEVERNARAKSKKGK
jgi:hypothetical protein